MDSGTRRNSHFSVIDADGRKRPRADLYCLDVPTPPRRRRTRSPDPTPVDVRATTFELGGERLAVLSFPVPLDVLPDCLTAAEREVGRALLDGHTNAQIAVARGTTVRTVANQVAAIFRKTGVRSRAEFVAAMARANH
jgi:DNA-binding CsgD family transcriptional regulator